MRVTLELLIDAEMFEIEEATDAEALANSTGGRVYTWKTIGKHNWLECGYSISDVAGLVVLPATLPDNLQMCEDLEKEE